MQHQRGDVPGPTTRGGDRPADSAPIGEPAAEAKASPAAPLGYGEGTSDTPGTEADPNPEKFYNPSEGESATRTSTPKGGGSSAIPKENG